MRSIQPESLFSTPLESIVDAEKNNKIEAVDLINGILRGKLLKDFSSSLGEVELFFEDDSSLKILPPLEDIKVRFQASQERSRLSEQPRLLKYPNAEVSLILENGSITKFKWDALDLLNNRVGMEFKGIFFNGEWLFTYWKDSDITAFRGEEDVVSECNMLYWFDTD